MTKAVGTQGAGKQGEGVRRAKGGRGGKAKMVDEERVQ